MSLFDFTQDASDPNNPNATLATPDQIARRQQMAAELMKQGADYSPVQSPWQGLARMANAALGGYMNYKEGQNAQDANKASGDALTAAMLGLKGGAPAASAPSMAPAGPPTPLGVSYASDGKPAPVPPGNIPPGPLTDAIQAAAAKNGVDPAYLTRTAQIESGYGKNLQSPLSSAGGPFAFTNGTAKQYGLVDKNDPNASADAAARLALDNRQALARALGRNPSNPELYLAHQQGAGGASALLQNPQANVVDALAPVYGGNRNAALQAVRNNGGSPDMTAAQFAGKWTGKFGGDGSTAIAQAAPQQVASNAPGLGYAPATYSNMRMQNADGSWRPATSAEQRDIIQQDQQNSGQPAPPSGPLSNFAPIPGSAPIAPAGFNGPVGVPPNASPADAAAAAGAADPVAPNPDVPAPGAVNAGPAPMPPSAPATPLRDTGDGSYANPFLEGSPQAAQAQQASQAKAAQAGQAVQLQQLMGVIQNPYTSPAQRQVATMLLQKYMGQEQWKDATGPNGMVGQRNTVTGEFKPLAEQPDQKWGVIGEDPMGRKIYGRPPAPGTQPAPPAVAPGANPDVMNLHGEDFIKTLDPGIQTQVKAIVEGRAPYPTGMLLKTPYGQQLAQFVTQADPSFDTANATSRTKVRNEFNAGGPSSPAGAITAGNTAIQHLGHLSDAAESLGNSDSSFPGAAKTYNVVKNALSSGKDAVPLTEFNNIVGKYVEEATKFYRGTGGTEADIQRDLSHLNPNMTPSELHAAIKTQAELLQSKINALQDRWKQGMGPLVPEFPIVHPESAKQMETIRKRAGGEAVTKQAAPSGEVAKPQSEAEYNALPPGASYIRPGETTPRIKGGK